MKIDFCGETRLKNSKNYEHEHNSLEFHLYIFREHKELIEKEYTKGIIAGCGTGLDGYFRLDHLFISR